MDKNVVITNKGYNKLLFKKRNALSLSAKEACKKLHISRLKLHLIENGYISLTKKTKKKFINAYSLESDFFDNDLAYPVMISEDVAKEASPWIRKLTNNIAYKIGCWVLAAGCLALSIVGVVDNINTKKNILSLFDENVIATREFAFHHYDDVKSHPNGEKDYILKNEKSILYGKNDISLSISDNDQKLPYLSFEGSLFTYEVVPFFKESEPIILQTSISHKFKASGVSYSATFKHGIRPIASCNVMEKNGNYSFSLVSIFDNDKLILLGNDDPRVQEVTNLFESHISDYTNSCKELFTDRPDIGVDYDSFKNGVSAGNKNLQGQTIKNSCFLLLGIIFSVLFFALAVLSFFKRTAAMDIDKNDASDDLSLKQEVKINNEPTKLKKNWKIFPIIPSAVLRIASIVMIFFSSIGTYLIFNSVVNVDVGQALELLVKNKIFSLFLVIAFILLLFFKIDYVQERKNYFLTNYFYFFCGIALYLLVLALSKLSVVDATIRGTIENVILNIVPGNFLWGFLAFNMAVYLLFYRPISYGNDEKKLFRFRLLAIIPFTYLTLSLIFGLLEDCAGVVFPFWFSFLFFTKATYLIVFVIIFTLFCFFYKRYTIKKYGVENAALYQKGNRYYFVKNFVAASIILVIGIFEIIAHFAFPNNGAGFGENILILIAIPFVLLYHPHHGKRNKAIDMSITIAYGFAYVVGIALIVLSLLIFIIKYL